MNRNIELINLVRIDLLKGKTNTDLDSLCKILLDNYTNKFDCDIDSTFFEDSICPQNKYVDEIIDDIKTDFFAATEEKRAIYLEESINGKYDLIYRFNEEILDPTEDLKITKDKISISNYKDIDL